MPSTSRATITANRLVNTYEWGDFKGDPHALVTQYFDAFLYYANCGARQLMLRRHAGENRRTDRVPARPPNMKRITGSQMALAEFLRIDLSGS